MALAITPLVKAAQTQRRWWGKAISYTLGGLVSSILTGALIGAAGAGLPPSPLAPEALLFAVGLALVAIARETRYTRLPLPQLRRQTPGRWAKTMPRGLVAAMWGFDLGLFFTTWLTFSGAWVVAAVAFLGGSPAFGASLLATYWLGRALSVWAAPLMLLDAGSTPQLSAALGTYFRGFQLVHAAALAVMAALLVIMFDRGIPLGMPV